MELWAGPFGVTQDETTGALRVAYGWAVVPARGKAPFIVRLSPHPWPSRIRIAKVPAAELQSLDALALHSNVGHVELWLWECKELTDLRGIEHLPRIVSLDLSGCTSLRSLEALRGRKDIENLVLTKCTALTDLEPLATLEELRYLCLMECINVTDLAPLRALPKLDRLVLWSCPGAPPNHQGNHRAG